MARPTLKIKATEPTVEPTLKLSAPEGLLEAEPEGAVLRVTLGRVDFEDDEAVGVPNWRLTLQVVASLALVR